MNRYIADLHFGHANIIRFDNRPFDSVEEMDETLIKNWNKKVKSGDTTYILGDFCWSRKEEDWIKILDSLNGSKVLIKGNHDIKQMSQNLRRKFADIKEKKSISDCGKTLHLDHYPYMAYKHSGDSNAFMLHGHVHYKTNEAILCRKLIKDIKETRTTDWDNRGQIINVGCMLREMDYTPRTLMEILHANGYCMEEK